MDDALRIVAVVVAAYVALVLALILGGRGRLARELAALVPNLAVLFAGLLRDPAVPWHAKAAVALAAIWIASPIDLVPEVIPIAGPIDDAIVAAIALRVVLRSTSYAVVARHWRGSAGTLERIVRIAGAR